jgi:hypothetical protein
VEHIARHAASLLALPASKDDRRGCLHDLKDEVRDHLLVDDLCRLERDAGGVDAGEPECICGASSTLPTPGLPEAPRPAAGYRSRAP